MIYRILYGIKYRIKKWITPRYVEYMTKHVFRSNHVVFSSFRSIGVPYVRNYGRMELGKEFVMNNGIMGNPIGCYDRCTLYVNHDSELIIGDYVGMSQAALISYCSIRIGNHVKIGGGVHVYTTDFHSLDPAIRASKDDKTQRVCKPVVISDNVFIGAQSIILKGVSIGKNSIIGAGSVVTKNVPANQIWAGNPAKFIRNI